MKELEEKYKQRCSISSEHGFDYVELSSLPEQWQSFFRDYVAGMPQEFVPEKTDCYSWIIFLVFANYYELID